MADLEFEEINRGNQPTQDGAGTDDAWTFTGKIIRNFNKIKAFFADSSNAASRKVGTESGDVMEVGAFGLGGIYLPEYEYIDEQRPAGFYAQGGGNADSAFLLLNRKFGHNFALRFSRINSNSTIPNLFLRHQQAGVWQDEVELLHTGNTTTDSNGFIKAASPIIKLFDDKIEKTDHLEIQPASLEKLGIGKYKLTGVPELSRDGWYIETPKDRNNNIYFTLDYEELDGELIIKTYKPDYSNGRAENGAPVDILEGRFVSLRFAEDPSLYPEPEEEISEE